ncbi:hypothetical protein [Burkholderia sp. Bp8990]|uniref:hypothetical protein n=1 Tax=Burkholderia sp. Bp8990 TaxID=2184552 RepID=UPI000F5AEDCD|nr:hypothetical protein [Burkholderia sp. Bp8990]
MSSSEPVVRMRHRPYLRALSPRNRRQWAEQRARLSPRIAISSSFVPLAISRQYAYIDTSILGG